MWHRDQHGNYDQNQPIEKNKTKNKQIKNKTQTKTNTKTKNKTKQKTRKTRKKKEIWEGFQGPRSATDLGPFNPPI